MRKMITLICCCLVITGFSQNVKSLEKTADSLKTAGKLDEAVKYYEKLIKTGENQAFYYGEKGWCEINLGRYDEGRKSIKKAIEYDPKCDRCYSALAITELNIGDPKKAFEYAEKAVQANENSGFNHYVLAQMHETRGELFKALDHYDKAIALEPEKAEYLYSRAVLNTRDQKYSLAIKDLSRAIELRNDVAIFYYERGRAYYALGMLKEAYKDAISAIYNEPENDGFVVGKGAIEEALGYDSLALLTYSSAISLNADNYIAYLNRANLYYEKEMLDESCSDYRSARYYLSIGENIQKEHIFEIEGMLSNHCDSSYASYYYQRGAAAFNREEFDLSLYQYDRGLERFPEHPILLAYKGNFLLSTGRYAEAEKTYSAALNYKGETPVDVSNNFILKQSNPNLDMYMRSNFATVYLNRAKAKLMLRDPEGALLDVQSSTFLANKVSNYPYYDNNNLFQAEVLSLQNFDNEALSILDKMIAERTKNPMVYVVRARIKMQKAVKKEYARKKWDYGFSLPSGFFYTLLPSGIKTKNLSVPALESALEDVKQAIAMNANIPEAYFVSAQIKSLLDRNDYCADLNRLSALGYEKEKELAGVKCKMKE